MRLYWHIPSIRFGRRVMRNTNSLIGRYPDADGMKTGFICASGFNVVATATRGGRKLIVVVFGSRSGMIRSEKAAQLFERGFSAGGISWLMPSFGTVEGLQPVAATPPNLRDEMCGRHRKRPAREEEDSETVQALNANVDPSSAYAGTLQSLRGGVATGPLLGPLQASVPIPVWTGLRRARSRRRKSRKGAERKGAARRWRGRRPRRNQTRSLSRDGRGKARGETRNRERFRRRLQPDALDQAAQRRQLQAGLRREQTGRGARIGRQERRSEAKDRREI